MKNDILMEEHGITAPNVGVTAGGFAPTMTQLTVNLHMTIAVPTIVTIILTVTTIVPTTENIHTHRAVNLLMPTVIMILPLRRLIHK